MERSNGERNGKGLIRQMSAIIEQKLAGNQCDQPSSYFCWRPLRIVKCPLLMAHPWLQRFHSKLVETPAGSQVCTMTQRILKSWTCLCFLLVEKTYQWLSLSGATGQHSPLSSEDPDDATVICGRSSRNQNWSQMACFLMGLWAVQGNCESMYADEGR